MFRLLSTLFTLLAGLTFAVPVHAVTNCAAGNANATNVVESTPTSAFTVNSAAGTVTHSLTGLTWKQCSLGQTGASCTGSGSAPNYGATLMRWSNALVAAAADATDGGGWRLPNKKELESIAEWCGYGPAINQTVFPATAASAYWSASSLATHPPYAWWVNFSDGVSFNSSKLLNGYVRLVRDGRLFDAFDAQADTIPAAFSFTAQTGAALGATVTSNTFTVAGINTASPISITGGTYQINSAAYTAASGNLSNGNTVTVQQTASSRYGVLTQAILTIGGVSAAFDVTTAGRLPDTGQTLCYNDTVADGVPANNPASIARDAGTHPRQDCRYGRDVAAPSKTGGGPASRDYSKIANNGALVAAGTALGYNPTDWACTQDNITGLMWEVKTTNGLRNSASTYSWYNGNPATNGGNAGTANGGSCIGGSGCDTEKFVVDVNSARLCNHADWRLPTLRELQTLLLFDGSSPSIDPAYFPNTQRSYFWSASVYAGVSSRTWAVVFSTGGADPIGKSNFNQVRLVRAGPF